MEELKWVGNFKCEIVALSDYRLGACRGCQLSFQKSEEFCPLMVKITRQLMTLIVGILWGAWYFLQGLWISGTYAGGLSLAVYMPSSVLSGVAQLTAYRILLAWVYGLEVC